MEGLEIQNPRKIRIWLITAEFTTGRLIKLLIKKMDKGKVIRSNGIALKFETVLEKKVPFSSSRF